MTTEISHKCVAGKGKQKGISMFYVLFLCVNVRAMQKVKLYKVYKGGYKVLEHQQVFKCGLYVCITW